ncbi:hypothetical protein CR513_06836, partial [Mucuna pruriens]
MALQYGGRSSSSEKLRIIASMTRKRSFGSFHPFDPKIEKTLNRIRKSKNMHVGHASDSFSSVTETDNFEMKPDFSDNPLYKPDPMENNNNRMLKELATLDSIMCTTWGDMKRMFLEKFPASRILCATCPHHQISKQLLLQYFYEGLLMMDRSMIDAASGGALMDKTPTTVRLLISNMVSNMQQFRIRGGVGTSKVVSEVSTFDNQRLENQLTELTSLVRQLVVSQHQQAVQRVYGICTSVEHTTDMCPTLKESKMKSIECVGALRGGHQYGRQLYPNR